MCGAKRCAYSSRLQGEVIALITIRQLAQRRAKNLAGLSDQRGAVHHAGRVGEGAGDADADRGRAAEQRIGVGAGGVALHQHLALEGVALHRIGAGVEQIGVAAKDLAIPEKNHAAALARTSVEQADVDRIQPVLHRVPDATVPGRGAPLPFCQTRCHGVNASGEIRVPGAMQRSSRCFAEPGPYQTPALVTAPAQQRTASQVLRAALRPGNAADHAYFLSRSKSSTEMPCGPRMKQMRTPGRMVVGSLVNSTPFALISAATASMSLTASPKWSRP